MLSTAHPLPPLYSPAGSPESSPTDMSDSHSDPPTVGWSVAGCCRLPLRNILQHLQIHPTTIKRSRPRDIMCQFKDVIPPYPQSRPLGLCQPFSRSPTRLQWSLIKSLPTILRIPQRDHRRVSIHIEGTIPTFYIRFKLPNLPSLPIQLPCPPIPAPPNPHMREGLDVLNSPHIPTHRIRVGIQIQRIQCPILPVPHHIPPIDESMAIRSIPIQTPIRGIRPGPLMPCHHRIAHRLIKHPGLVPRRELQHIERMSILLVAIPNSIRHRSRLSHLPNCQLHCVVRDSSSLISLLRENNIPTLEVLRKQKHRDIMHRYTERGGHPVFYTRPRQPREWEQRIPSIYPNLALQSPTQKYLLFPALDRPKEVRIAILRPLEQAIKSNGVLQGAPKARCLRNVPQNISINHIYHIRPSKRMGAVRDGAKCMGCHIYEITNR